MGFLLGLVLGFIGGIFVGKEKALALFAQVKPFILGLVEKVKSLFNKKK